jgi:uncharacterized DUF497 family protein
MPWYDVFWTDDSEQHLAEHGITPEEAAFVVRNPVEIRTSHSSGRPIAVGVTETGRRLLVVYELDDDGVTAHLITAWEL